MSVMFCAWDDCTFHEAFNPWAFPVLLAVFAVLLYITAVLACFSSVPMSGFRFWEKYGERLGRKCLWGRVGLAVACVLASFLCLAGYAACDAGSMAEFLVMFLPIAMFFTVASLHACRWLYKRAG